MSHNEQQQALEEARRVVKEAKRELQLLRDGQVAETRELAKQWVSIAHVVQTAGGFFARHPAVMLTLLYAQVGIAGVVYVWSLFQQFGLSIGAFTSVSDFLLAAFSHPLAFGIAFALVTLQGVAAYHVTVTYGRVSQASLELSRTLRESVRKHMNAITTATEHMAGAFEDSRPQSVKDLRASQQQLSQTAQVFEGMEQEVMEIANRTERRLRWWWGFVIVLGLMVTLIGPYTLGCLDATRIKQGDAARLTVEYASRGEDGNAVGLSREVSVIATSDKFGFFYDPARRQVLVIPISNIAGVYYAQPEPAPAAPSASPEASGTEVVTAIAR